MCPCAPSLPLVPPVPYRSAHLATIVEKAEGENNKVGEVSFIHRLSEENCKQKFQSRMARAESRRNERINEVQRRAAASASVRKQTYAQEHRATAAEAALSKLQARLAEVEKRRQARLLEIKHHKELKAQRAREVRAAATLALLVAF